MQQRHDIHLKVAFEQLGFYVEKGAPSAAHRVVDNDARRAKVGFHAVAALHQPLRIAHVAWIGSYSCALRCQICQAGFVPRERGDFVARFREVAHDRGPGAWTDAGDQAGALRFVHGEYSSAGWMLAH